MNTRSAERQRAGMPRIGRTDEMLLQATRLQADDPIKAAEIYDQLGREAVDPDLKAKFLLCQSSCFAQSGDLRGGWRTLWFFIATSKRRVPHSARGSQGASSEW